MVVRPSEALRGTRERVISARERREQLRERRQERVMAARERLAESRPAQAARAVREEARETSEEAKLLASELGVSVPQARAFARSANDEIDEGTDGGMDAPDEDLDPDGDGDTDLIQRFEGDVTGRTSDRMSNMRARDDVPDSRAMSRRGASGSSFVDVDVHCGKRGRKMEEAMDVPDDDSDVGSRFLAVELGTSTQEARNIAERGLNAITRARRSGRGNALDRDGDGDTDLLTRIEASLDERRGGGASASRESLAADESFAMQEDDIF